jgi:YfiH family protein
MAFTHLPLLTSVPRLHHVITTRHGGVSTAAFASLNLGYHVGDDDAAVTANRRRLAEAAGFNLDRLVTAQQVHGMHIAWVGANDAGCGATSWEDAVPRCDGLITAERHLPLMIQTADCAAVLLTDPVNRVLAVLHAGWRGALQRIASTAVRQLIDGAGTDPARLVAGIGPAICPACFAVGEETADAMREAFGPAVVTAHDDQPHVDLPAAVAADLRSAGIPAAQIEVHPDCTQCRSDRYFSHRGQGGRAGRIAMVAWWE